MIHKAIVTSLITVLTLSSIALTAQNRRFDEGNDKKSVRIEHKSPRSKTTKSKRQNSYVTPPIHSTRDAYAALLNEQQYINSQIETLVVALRETKGGKAKKISSQINELTNQVEIIGRKLATYPLEIRDPNYQRPVETDELFNAQLDELISLRISQTDAYAGTISSDPELEQLYRDYLKDNGYIPIYSFIDGQRTEIADNTGVTYRVMIAISRQPLPISAFDSMTDISEQRMPNGGIIYYQGAYNTKAEADAACNEILAKGKARDSFVVAMRGGKRIPLPN